MRIDRNTTQGVETKKGTWVCHVKRIRENRWSNKVHELVLSEKKYIFEKRQRDIQIN